MVATQIYIGQIPEAALARRMLRQHALELAAQLRQASTPAPSVALMSFAAAPPPAPPVDLLLLRPGAIVVGAVRNLPGPIEAQPGGPWRLADGAPLDEPAGSPLDTARAQRDAVMARLQAAGSPWGLQQARVVGAVVVVPAVHPDSRISLDVDDHRQGLKVCGLDELAGVAAMIQSGAQLAEPAMRAVAAELFGARLWFDGLRPLFDLAPARFQLRMLSGERAGEAVPLPEGETVVGRRRSPRRFERRVAVTGDDLVSSDHAAIFYGDGDTLLLKDSSKNGTWVVPAGADEQHLRGAVCTLAPGALIRMGVTRMRLEKVEG